MARVRVVVLHGPDSSRARLTDLVAAVPAADLVGWVEAGEARSGEAVIAMLHRGSGRGAQYWGPGDKYTFLVTGAECGGRLFAMEALVPTGGGPPPHIHRREDETFYVLDGLVTFRLGD